MKTLPLTSAILVCGLVLSSSAAAQNEPEETIPTHVHITNVTIFDGVNKETINGSVLIENNLIKEVGAKVKAPSGATVIDGGGRFLMPGIIEGHGHLMLSKENTAWFNTHDVFYLAAAAAGEAEGYLMRGWTTVRDIGGPSAGHR